jgi:predicted transcriptional regulator
MAGRRDGEAVGRRAFGELEGDVLAVLWAAGRPLSTPEVHEAVGAGLAYTTVSTVLSRLVDKGLVTREKHGRALEYTPTTDEAQVATAGFRSVLTRSHDRRALLQGFVESLSRDDEAMLRDLLDQSVDGPEREG